MIPSPSAMRIAERKSLDSQDAKRILSREEYAEKVKAAGWSIVDLTKKGKEPKWLVYKPSQLLAEDEKGKPTYKR